MSIAQDAICAVLWRRFGPIFVVAVALHARSKNYRGRKNSNNEVETLISHSFGRDIHAFARQLFAGILHLAVSYTVAD